MMDVPPNFLAHQTTSTDTPTGHSAVDIDGLRRHQSVQQTPHPMTTGSPQVEVMEGMSIDRVPAPIKQLSELELGLSKLIPKGVQQQQQQTQMQQGQVKLYSEVVRQQSITVSSNEPQNVCITTTGDEVTSTKHTEEPVAKQTAAVPPPAMVRKVSRFQVSTVVEQQQVPIEEKAVVVNSGAPAQSSVTIQHNPPPDTSVVFQQQSSQGEGKRRDDVADLIN